MTVGASGTAVSSLSQDVDLETALHSNPAASVRLEPDGTYDVLTPVENWSWAIIVKLPELLDVRNKVGLRVHLEMNMLSGEAGSFISVDAPNSILGSEQRIFGGGNHHIVFEQRGASPTALCVRSFERGTARFKLIRVRVVALCGYPIDDELDRVLIPMLRSSSRLALESVATSLAKSRGETISAENIGALSLASNRLPIPLPELHRVFDDEVGTAAIAAHDELLALLPTYRHEKLATHLGHFDTLYWKHYLRQNVSRVWHLVHLLRECDFHRGTVLEVGAFMGSFALTLQKLGYSVSALDRYHAHDGALDGYTEHLRSAGIEVVATDRSDESGVLDGLGNYQAVISMAVIEHIPHTPRPFMSALASHVKDEGLCAFDTPNIARYWNRRLMQQGQSVHQDLATQFFCEPPYEGHHREYTGDELVWMMQQIGCSDIQLRRFDYNLFQFSELERPHADVLLQMVVDPTLMDTILAAGRIR